MTKPPETTSNEPTFNPKRMQEIVARLQAEDRMPSPEQLNEVLQKYRKEHQKRVQELRQR